MKRLNSKQIIPICTGIFGLIFIYVGFTKLGFWDNEPKPGFFPSIIAIVLVLASLIAFLQNLKEKEGTKYNKDEFLVIIGTLSIILGSFVLGLIPMVFLYLTLWLKFIEKSSWKAILIINIIMAIIVIGIFALWLQVRFPWGIFEMWL